MYFFEEVNEFLLFISTLVKKLTHCYYKWLLLKIGHEMLIEGS